MNQTQLGQALLMEVMRFQKQHPENSQVNPYQLANEVVKEAYTILSGKHAKPFKS